MVSIREMVNTVYGIMVLKPFLMEPLHGRQSSYQKFNILRKLNEMTDSAQTLKQQNSSEICGI